MMKSSNPLAFIKHNLLILDVRIKCHVKTWVCIFWNIAANRYGDEAQQLPLTDADWGWKTLHSIGSLMCVSLLFHMLPLADKSHITAFNYDICSFVTINKQFMINQFLK